MCLNTSEFSYSKLWINYTTTIQVFFWKLECYVAYPVRFVLNVSGVFHIIIRQPRGGGGVGNLVLADIYFFSTDYASLAS